MALLTTPFISTYPARTTEGPLTEYTVCTATEQMAFRSYTRICTRPIAWAAQLSALPADFCRLAYGLASLRGSVGGQEAHDPNAPRNRKERREQAKDVRDAYPHCSLGMRRVPPL